MILDMTTADRAVPRIHTRVPQTNVMYSFKSSIWVFSSVSERALQRIFVDSFHTGRYCRILFYICYLLLNFDLFRRRDDASDLIGFLGFNISHGMFKSHIKPFEFLRTRGGELTCSFTGTNLLNTQTCKTN